MRRRLRSIPAWTIVVVFGCAAAAVGLLAGDEPGTIHLIAVVSLLVALIAVLVARSDGDGWGIYGTMVIFNLVMQAVDWPLIAEAPVFILGSAGVVWALFDRPRSRAEPSSAVGDRQQACG